MEVLPLAGYGRDESIEAVPMRVQYPTFKCVLRPQYKCPEMVRTGARV